MRPMGGFGKDARFPAQNAEGENVMEAAEDEIEEDAMRDSSVNARKTSPYGPGFPMLAKYFKAK